MMKTQSTVISKELKNIGLVLWVIFVSLSVNVNGQGDSLNMNKIASWMEEDTATYYNDIWGYDADGREYAIMGSNHSTYFIDVTDEVPVLVDSFSGNDRDVIWRDFKTYQHYAYGVSDGADNSLQIFDLSGLPDSVTKVYDSQEFTESCHNIFIDGDRLYLCSNTRPGQGLYALDVLSLANPEQPTLITNVSATHFSGSGVHDIFVRNDTAFCSSEYSGLYIYDFTDIFNPTFIAAITTYEDQGYNHSSWVSDDRKTLVMADEVPHGLALKLFDISDITDPVYITKFKSNADARPHNPFFRQGKIIISYYLDGVQVFDATNSLMPVRSAYYDTYPDNDTIPGSVYPDDSFDGCWGVYPFLPSGKIIASDGKYGLFVLNTDEILGTSALEENQRHALQLFPNPVVDEGKMVVRSVSRISKLQVKTILGEVILNKSVQNSYLSEVDLSDFTPGIYLIEVQTVNGWESGRVVVK